MDQHRKPTATVKFITEDVDVFQEFYDAEDSFSHRIRIGKKKGQWSGYLGISTLRYKDRTYCSTTEYYAGTFPAVFVFDELARIGGDNGSD